jgi:hypothetical protein
MPVDKGGNDSAPVTIEARHATKCTKYTVSMRFRMRTWKAGRVGEAAASRLRRRGGSGGQGWPERLA